MPASPPGWDDPVPKSESFMHKVEHGIEKVGEFTNSAIKIGSKVASGLEWVATLLTEADQPQPIDV